MHEYQSKTNIMWPGMSSRVFLFCSLRARSSGGWSILCGPKYINLCYPHRMVACYYLNQVGVVPRMTFTEKSPVDGTFTLASGYQQWRLYLLLGLISHPHPEYIKKTPPAIVVVVAGVNTESSRIVLCTTHIHIRNRWGVGDRTTCSSSLVSRIHVIIFANFVGLQQQQQRDRGGVTASQKSVYTMCKNKNNHTSHTHLSFCKHFSVD